MFTEMERLSKELGDYKEEAQRGVEALRNMDYNIQVDDENDEEEINKVSEHS